MASIRGSSQWRPPSATWLLGRAALAIQEGGVITILLRLFLGFFGFILKSLEAWLHRRRWGRTLLRTGQFLLALVITLLGLLIFAGAYAGRAQVTACLVWGAISVVLTLLGISMLVDAIHPGALEPDTPEKRLGRLLDRAQALRATLPADSDDYRQLDTAVHGVENLMRQAVDQIRQGSTVDKSLVDVMIEFLSKAITAAGGKTD